MSWFLIALFLGSAVVNVSEGTDHENKKLPSAVVVGTVYCDTCFQQGFSRTSHFLSGFIYSCCVRFRFRKIYSKIALLDLIIFQFELEFQNLNLVQAEPFFYMAVLFQSCLVPFLIFSGG